MKRLRISVYLLAALCATFCSTTPQSGSVQTGKSQSGSAQTGKSQPVSAQADEPLEPYLQPYESLNMPSMKKRAQQRQAAVKAHADDWVVVVYNGEVLPFKVGNIPALYKGGSYQGIAVTPELRTKAIDALDKQIADKWPASRLTEKGANVQFTTAQDQEQERIIQSLISGLPREDDGKRKDYCLNSPDFVKNFFAGRKEAETFIDKCVEQKNIGFPNIIRSAMNFKAIKAITDDIDDRAKFASEFGGSKLVQDPAVLRKIADIGLRYDGRSDLFKYIERELRTDSGEYQSTDRSLFWLDINRVELIEKQLTSKRGMDYGAITDRDIERCADFFGSYIRKAGYEPLRFIRNIVASGIMLDKDTTNYLARAPKPWLKLARALALGMIIPDEYKKLAQQASSPAKPVDYSGIIDSRYKYILERRVKELKKGEERNEIDDADVKLLTTCLGDFIQVHGYNNPQSFITRLRDSGIPQAAKWKDFTRALITGFFDPNVLIEMDMSASQAKERRN